MRRTVMALGLLAAVSCGGLADAPGGGGSGGTSGAAGGSGASGAAGAAGSQADAAPSDASPVDPCLGGDVRLCQAAGQCPWLGAGSCLGGGCDLLYEDVSEADSTAGICFADLPDAGGRSCPGCEDGEVCLSRAPDEWVCVAEAVCSALWRLGVEGVCRYADFAAYDGRPLPTPSGCPDTSGVCAGDCAECAGSRRCTGRSPDHPFGYCAGAPNDTCSVGDGVLTDPCRTLGVCGVFTVSASDNSAARRFGDCLFEPDCLDLARGLPGGFECYAADGTRLQP